jgi:hypothetical protein
METAREQKKQGNWLNPATGKHHNDRRVELTCETCEEIFLRSRAHVNKHNFCSRKCLGTWNSLNSTRVLKERLELICTECGNFYYKLESQKRSKYGFCSVSCVNKWHSNNLSGEDHYNWKGGKRAWSWYGKDWIAQRKRALERDKYTCQMCGITKKELGKNPDVHHIIAFRRFGLERHEEANKLENLLSLCSTCHTTIEAQTERRNKEKVI